VPAIEAVSGKRVLVVDDELWLRVLIAEMFTADGYAVDTAVDGAEALSKVRQRPYDMIVCDVQMPELDGLGLYRELARERPELVARFVFVTGSRQDGPTWTALKRTGAPCLAKPFTAEELRRVARQILSG